METVKRRVLCGEVLAHQAKVFRPRAAKDAKRKAQRHSAMRAWHAKCVPSAPFGNALQSSENAKKGLSSTCRGLACT